MDISWGTQTSLVVFGLAQVITWCTLFYCFRRWARCNQVISSLVTNLFKENKAWGTSSFLPLECTELFSSNQSPTSWLFGWRKELETYLTHFKWYFMILPTSSTNPVGGSVLHPRIPSSSHPNLGRAPTPSARLGPAFGDGPLRGRQKYDDRRQSAIGISVMAVVEVGLEDLCQSYAFFVCFLFEFSWDIWHLIFFVVREKHVKDEKCTSRIQFEAFNLSLPVSYTYTCLLSPSNLNQWTTVWETQGESRRNGYRITRSIYGIFFYHYSFILIQPMANLKLLGIISTFSRKN